MNNSIQNKNLLNNVMLGTWGLAGENKISDMSLGWPKIENEIISNILDKVVTEDIGWIEMSDFYGNGLIEKFIGNKFFNHRSKIKLATKGGVIPEFTDNYGQLKKDFSSNYLKFALDKSLDNLKTNYIDLYQLHGANANTLKNKSLQIFLKEMKSSSKVKSIGISLGSKNIIDNLDKLSQYEFIDYIQVPYSLDNPKLIYSINKWKEQYTGNLSLIGRSIFLHGLLCKDNPSLILDSNDHRSRKYSNELIEKVNIFKLEIKKELDLSLRDAILLFSINNKHLKNVIIGATKEEHIQDWKNIITDDKINNDFSEKILKISNNIFSKE